MNSLFNVTVQEGRELLALVKQGNDNNSLKNLFNKYSTCILCGGVKVKYDTLGKYFFIEYTSKKCILCEERSKKREGVLCSKNS